MRIPKLTAVVVCSVLAAGMAAETVAGPANAAEVAMPASVRTDVGEGVEAARVRLSHREAARRLRGANVTWSSSGNCSDRNISTCTSFSKVNRSSIRGIITFKKASHCGVNITGGTETGHSPGTYSHWNGYKIDISPRSCVSRYIKRTYTYIGERGDGASMYKSGAGDIYARESTHWDILYYNCGC